MFLHPKFLKKVYRHLKFILQIKDSFNFFYYRKMPLVLQFPITTRCNSKCLMCNVWKIRPGKDINLQDLSVYLKDPIFSKIRSVGINGGEPSLFKELPELVKIILELPRLKSINIISNGFLSENFLYNCEEINNNCKENKIRFHISISLDGVEAIHDKIRGVKGAYERTIKTIQILQKNKNRYCDTYDIGCTITKYNIFYLNELLALSELKHLPIFFRLAVANLRIDSQNSYRDYGVLTENRYKMTAQEFFFGMFLRAHNLSEKFKYFAIYHYLYNNGLDRLSQCTWQNRDITLDDSGNLYYCAVESKKLGNLNINTGHEIVFNKQNINYRKTIVKNKCNYCIHYTFNPNIKGVLLFYKFLFHQKLCWERYKINI